MVHLCPNYAVPYEPHFSRLLIPLAPRLTARFLPVSVGTSSLWRSLNFITLPQIRRLAVRHGLRATFASGQMHKAFERLGSDEEFARRHSPLVHAAGRFLRATGLLEGEVPTGLLTVTENLPEDPLADDDDLAELAEAEAGTREAAPAETPASADTTEPGPCQTRCR